MCKECGTIYQDQLCHIKSRNISLVNHLYIQASAKRGGIVYNSLPIDSDNNSDTHLFGANFWTIMYTRQRFTVASFITEYSEQTDFPIVMGAKYFDNNNGMKYLLVFGQGL